MHFQPFGATNAPDSCLWCGRTLPRPRWIKRERGALPTRCKHCRSTNLAEAGGSMQVRCLDCGDYSAAPFHIVERTPQYAKPGGYGDGHFCGLSCGYQFGRVMANGGRRLKPAESATT